MYETIRIVEKLKPKYVIWENVKNLLSKKHRHNFNNYLDKMSELGYRNYYQVLNAKDYGIPQNRERVFTISIREDIDFFHEFRFPEKEELKLRLKDMLEDQVDEKYYLSEKAIKGRLNTNYEKYKLEKNAINDLDVHPTILARYEGAPTLLKEEIQLDGSYGRDYGSKGKLQDNDVCDTLQAAMGEGGGNVPILKVVGNYSPSGHEASRIIDQDGIAPTIKENHGTVAAVLLDNNVVSDKRLQKLVDNTEFEEGSEPFIVACRGRNPESPSSREPSVHTEQRLEPNTKGITNTITSVQKDNYVAEKKEEDKLRIRKLTPKECWRLMGFTDEEFEKAEQVNSNAQLYKQAGNSIVVNVLEKILMNLVGGVNDRRFWRTIRNMPANP